MKLPTVFFLILTFSPGVIAMGNFPASTNCPPDKPYYAFCSHSLHNLEGWFGDCHDAKQQAEADAEQHIQQEHKGNSRWTGVLDSKSKGY